MHLWIGTVFTKSFSTWLHAISSKELLDYIFSFWLLFFPLLKPIRWLGSVPPLGLFSSEYFGRQKILLGKCLLQWVTMCYNRSQYITLCYNMSQCNGSQWVTYRYNDFYIVLKCARMCHNIIFSLENVYISFKRGEERRRWNFMFTKS